MPARTATEQMLISLAADNAARKLRIGIGPERKAFLYPSNFDGFDGRYAVSAIKEALLKQGVRLVEDKAMADCVIEIRAGALSINQTDTIVGVPATNVQFFAIPEVSVFSSTEKQGVAKFAAFAYDLKTGELITVAPPVYGFSRRNQNQAFSSFSWGTPENYGEENRERGTFDWFSGR